MTKLNRYVLTSFLKPLFLSYVSMTILILMAELMERLDKIIASKATFLVVARYLLALWPVRSMELFPVAALLAALFSIGQLSRRMEITAAMAGGIHPWRIVSPLLYVGIALSIFTWGLGEVLTPWANREVKTLWNVEIKKITSPRQSLFNNVTVPGEGVFYAIGLLDLNKERMQNVVIDLVENGAPRHQWQAREGLWTPEGWRLFNGTERTYKGLNRLDQQIPFKEKQTTLLDKPDDLVPRDLDPEEMNLRELGQHIQRLKILGIETRKAEVERYMKTALPWANLIIVMLGIPFAFNKRGGNVRAVAVALGVAFAYFGLLQVGRAFGLRPWCPPLFGAWFANVVFLIIGTRLFIRMRSLS
ncbi:MAG: LptF/LptG family permease [Elusimicrobia bacterium]|jgi:lipopolysaccharide export system permease protein|nr:LptF/LptG family permease [Elusimicrobiota bacterium]